MKDTWLPFLSGTDDKVLLAPSGNIEAALRNAEVQGNGFTWGGKNPLFGFQHHPLAGGVETYSVISTGHHFAAITGTVAHRLEAGSSINVAVGLLRLGIVPADIRLIVPQGADLVGQELAATLQARRVETLLLPANETGFALNVHTSDNRSTIFGRRPDYQVSDEFLAALRARAPRLAVLSSIRPVDLPIAEAVFASRAKRRVLVAHQELLLRSDLRDRLQALVARADLFQANRSEAAQLLGLSQPEEFRPEMIAEIASFGARYSVVTLDGDGAIMMGPNGEIFRQEAFPVENIDPIGAGDVHLAVLSFFLWLHGGVGPQEALRRAAKGAAHKVTREGSWSGAPTAAECE